MAIPKVSDNGRSRDQACKPLDIDSGFRDKCSNDQSDNGRSLDQTNNSTESFSMQRLAEYELQIETLTKINVKREAELAESNKVLIDLKRDVDEKNDLILKNQQMFVVVISNDNSRNLSSGHRQHSNRGQNNYQQPPNINRQYNYRGRGCGRE